MYWFFPFCILQLQLYFFLSYNLRKLFFYILVKTMNISCKQVGKAITLILWLFSKIFTASIVERDKNKNLKADMNSNIKKLRPFHYYFKQKAAKWGHLNLYFNLVCLHAGLCLSVTIQHFIRYRRTVSITEEGEAELLILGTTIVLY